MAKKRNAVGYTLPGQDDDISIVDDGNMQGRVGYGLKHRGTGVRHGPVDETLLPSGSSSTVPQGMLFLSS